MFFMFLTHMSNFIQIIFCERLDRNYLVSGVLRFGFFFFFFFFLSFFHVFQLLGDKFHCSCIVHSLFTGPITTLFRKKKILKMGPMALFTYLKIILLQCFQFLTQNFEM